MNNDSNEDHTSILMVNEVLESTDDNETIYVPGSSTEDEYYSRVINAVDDQTSMWGVDWDYEEPQEPTEEEQLHNLTQSYGEYDVSGRFVCGYCISLYFLDECAGDGTIEQYRNAVQEGHLLDTRTVGMRCSCQDSDDADQDWEPMDVDTYSSEISDDVDPTVG